MINQKNDAIGTTQTHDLPTSKGLVLPETKPTATIKEIDFKNILGITEEEKDDSVNYYMPFCIYGDGYDGKQQQAFLDYDALIKLAELLKPYLDDYKAREQAEQEFNEDFLAQENGIKKKDLN